MNEIKDSNDIINECPECKNRTNRTLIDKIKHKLSYALTYTKSVINFLSHFILEFLKTRPGSLAKTGKACIEKYENNECLNEEHAIIIINHKKASKNIYPNSAGLTPTHCQWFERACPDQYVSGSS